jgi:RHS repeat-associated protein
MVGRYKGFNIGAEYSVSYGFDSLGRFSNLTNDPNGTNETFTYSYLPNSNLISGISYPNNISVTKSYESNRDLVTSIENSVTSVPSVVSKYDYLNDVLGRRMSVGKSGAAFTLADTIAYGYNDKSEVTSAVATSNTLYNYGFNFDPIGNRQSSVSSESGTPVSTSYTSNSLNQYTVINHGNPVNPVYDFDGNAVVCPLSSGVWSLTWDAENRLISATNGTNLLEFKYDYQGRRVEKKVFTGSPGFWILTSDSLFVYDGFLQIEQLNALDSNSIEKKRVWEPGGNRLLSETNYELSAMTYYAFSDANKNITDYVDSLGILQAHYEFSPFGKITVASGVMPDAFDFRFSSEYFDDETGLVYYNFRYYSPELGRWLSRDPIEEKGGWNLYAMVHNNPIWLWDYLGQSRHSRGL